MTERWRFIEVVKDSLQGQVWLVKSLTGETGYFKWNRGYSSYWSAPLVVNEVIAAALGWRLGLPVATVEPATVMGPRGRAEYGVVSVCAKGGTTLPWKTASPVVRRDPERYINRIDRFAQVVVFDTWIANYDRYIGDNLILWQRPGRAKYDWYLVDHALGLYGSPQKWRRVGARDSDVWQMVWRFYWDFPGDLMRIHTWERLEPMISRIENLRTDEIDGAIAAVPREAMTARLHDFTRDLLLSRQPQVRAIMRRWLEHEGMTASPPFIATSLPARPTRLIWS